MISCHLMGGLGNQMFQVATTHTYARDNNREDVYPLTTDLGASRKKSYEKDVLRKIKRTDITKIRPWAICREPNHTFFNIPKNVEHKYLYLDGYFQSYKYFDHRKKEIKDLFEPTEEIKNYINEKYNFDEKSVSIHVRRGDYVNLKDIHFNLPLKYYEDALQHFDKKENNFYVFSDDIEWCKKQSLFQNLNNIIFVDEDEVVSLYMMEKCFSHIIANSSFSWWGAYLANVDDKKGLDDRKRLVICPTVWFGPKGPKWNILDIAPSFFSLLKI